MKEELLRIAECAVKCSNLSNKVKTCTMDRRRYWRERADFQFEKLEGLVKEFYDKYPEQHPKNKQASIDFLGK